MDPELNEFMWLCYRKEEVIHKNTVKVLKNNSYEIMRRYIKAAG